MPRTRLYRHGVLESEGFPAEEIARHLRDPDVTVWLDLCAPSEQELTRVGDMLGLHELAMEDALHAHQRPKFDRYDGHCFLTAYAVRLDEHKLNTFELGVFVTPNAVVTVRSDEAFDIDEVTARWDSSAQLAKSGVGFLLHGLLDYVVDGHFAAVQSMDDHIENLEDLVFSEHPNDSDMQRRTLTLRRSLVTLRRVVTPMREVVNSLMQHEHSLVDDAIRPYFHDVYDHVLRASEWTESLRDLVNTIRETQLNIQSNRLNLIMKKVTGWAAIIAVPTAITGFYGQNVPYPGSGQVWGFWVSTVATLLLGGGLYLSFKRKDWL